MEKTIQILKDRTFNLFNDQWYEVTAKEILTPNSKNEFGYIYIVRIGTSNKCKIGFSNNIIKRVNSFKTTLGNNLVLDGFIYCENYSSVEKNIHLKLSQNKIHGEWFKLTPELMQEVVNENNGVLTLCSIDNNLIIEDGVFVSGKSVASTVSYKLEGLEKNKIFLETIYSYMRLKKITTLKATTKELYQFIFSEDKSYTSTLVLRQLKESVFKPVDKATRFTSFFDGSPIVGFPYIINLPYES